eukprot:CAMPEP_0168720274 /NCGR_PEP_ID=MMETSP0724-20121128/1474_1 /TAXON_ID=265536 /ORGANISM="Amphiprora sp., Strain CCMP467" /LENGTH=225 /DNA_ID=CAMNT_0008766863 /DNA_START=403 /DNA_END=1077 /DNA_ORIENTATION=-
MPPNRKNDLLLLDDYPLVDASQLKLPETREQPATATAVTSPPQSADVQQQDSYWDWDTDHKDEVIQQIQHEEKIRQLFSVSHLEENLVKESQRLQALEQEEDHAQSSAKESSDDYWNMPTSVTDVSIINDAITTTSTTNVNNDTRVSPDTTTSTTEAQTSRASASYWNWPSVTSQEKERMIQLVLEEERARRLTSGRVYESHLVADAAQMQETSPALKAAHDSYW